MLDTVPANGTSFRLIRRWNPAKCVISAIAVRGNTTIFVTISGNGTVGKEALEETVPEFKTYLATMGMRPYRYTNYFE